jgi:branched-chain amino acid transport system permease protein
MTQGMGVEARKRRATVPASWYVTLGVVAALALLPRVIATPYYLHLLIFVLLYVGLASAWNLMGGFAGQLSLGHAGFFGIGAYTSTLLSLHFGLSPWIGMVVGVLLAMVAGAAIGYPCFRLKGPFFALATLAFGEVLRIVAIAWVDLTQGSNGLSIPFKPGFKNMMWQGKEMFFYLILVYALAAVGIAWRIERSRLGYYLIALKEDDAAARMLGIDTTRYKLYATLISAALTAVGGVFYAQYIGYIEPYSVFDVNQSVQFALISIIGGIGTVIGPVFGAFIMIPLTEVLRAMFGGMARGFHLVLYGIILIVVVMLIPQGLSLELRERYKRWRVGRQSATSRRKGQADVA